MEPEDWGDRAEVLRLLVIRSTTSWFGEAIGGEPTGKLSWQSQALDKLLATSIDFSAWSGIVIKKPTEISEYRLQKPSTSCKM